MRKVFSKLRKTEHLSDPEMTEAMESLVTGKLTDDEIELLLTGLREKGESVIELVSAVKVMRAHAVKLSREYPEALDTCGTGGDSSNTLNVSTLAALTAAAAGVQVAKHGNRSVSSTCGSADILELLGIPIDLPPDKLEASLQTKGFAFFFAPRFYEATRFAMPTRKKIGGKTIFNLLGPLANPAGAKKQLIGVYAEKWLKPMAEALQKLGSERALVVHGKDGTDEISLTGETAAVELKDGALRFFTLSPGDFGLKKSALKEFQVDSKDKAKEAALKILKGSDSPQSDLVAVNAGAALYVAGRAKTPVEGFQKASALLHNGSVMKKVEELR